MVHIASMYLVSVFSSLAGKRTIKYCGKWHSWASASRKLTPASAFRHPSSQSGTGSKKCRTASFCSGTGHVPTSLVVSSPVPDRLDAGQSGIPAFSNKVDSKFWVKKFHNFFTLSLYRILKIFYFISWNFSKVLTLFRKISGKFRLSLLTKLYKINFKLYQNNKLNSNWIHEAMFHERKMYCF
jgi:hypothetical protein